LAQPKGSTGNPNGRPKGSVNKKTAQAQDIADRLGIDPFEILLKFAAGDWKGLGYKSPTTTRITEKGSVITEDIISPELKSTSAGKAIEFLYPKRKAIDHQVESDGTINLTRTIINKTV